jgi:arylsulfatase A-like enzyme
MGATTDLKFFLFLHTFQTHNPYLSPAPFGQMFLKNHHPWKGVYLQKILGQGFPRLFARLDPVQRENLIALYDGEIRYADEAFVQPLLQELRRLGLYDRTLIILTSDHGEEFYDHSSWEHSHTLYDELIRVPLIVKFPESGHQGKKIPNLVRSVDIAPTILEITRAGDSGMEMDGESVLPLLKNRKTKERLGLSLLPHRMIAFIPQKMAIIEAGRKFIVNRDFEPQAYQYFTPPPPRLDPFELYDLVRDPSEKNNRAGRETAEVRVLFRRAEKLFRMQEGKLKSQKILLDKELEDQLRTLGYIK